VARCGGRSCWNHGCAMTSLNVSRRAGLGCSMRTTRFWHSRDACACGSAHTSAAEKQALCNYTASPMGLDWTQDEDCQSPELTHPRASLEMLAVHVPLTRKAEPTDSRHALLQARSRRASSVMSQRSELPRGCYMQLRIFSVIRASAHM